MRRLREGKKPGYPRFKSGARYRCIEIYDVSPGMVKTSKNGKVNIKIKGLPILKLRDKRELPPAEKLKVIRIVRRPKGYYVDLVYQVGKPLLPPTGNRTGIDLGVSQRITLSSGESYPTAEKADDREKKLRAALSRKQKGSNRRKKAVVALSRETHRNRIRRRNELHRISTGLICRFDRIAVEDLNIVSMTASAR